MHVFHKDMAVSYCCVWMFAIKRWNCNTAVCACLSERDGTAVLLCVHVCLKEMVVSDVVHFFAVTSLR